MKFLARLRWGVIGLRGRLVAAVVLASVVTLAVAAVVLLPRLEHSLKNAALNTLKRDIAAANKGKKTSGLFTSLAAIPYEQLPLLVHGYHDARFRQTNEYQSAEIAASSLAIEESTAQVEVGASYVGLVGYIDSQGEGRLVASRSHQGSHGTRPVAASRSDESSAADTGPGRLDDVRGAYLGHGTVYSFGTVGNRPVVRAAVWLKGDDAVFVIRKSIDEIPGAVGAVRHAFEIAAVIAILLMLVIAIPLAGTLVRRLQRLREAALQMAVGGTGAAVEVPADRARDEVGDLARSFSIMQRRLRQQEQARRGFVATASHELRTPLASLNGMLELLSEDLVTEDPDLEDAQRLLDRARAQSRRLSRLAADLLDLSRIDAEVDLRSEPLELGEMVRAVLAEFELSSRERGVTAVLRDQGVQTWVLADPGSVARILRILLDNGLRVAPRGSEVTVTVTPGEMPTLSVSDRGPGVAQEERALIFERFKRGAETGGEAGFGLGLAIGRELAERMGGTLVLSDTGGPGATFTLTLRGATPPADDPLVA